MTAQGPMEKAVTAAIRAAEIPPRDKAGVQLVRRYAQLLDVARGRDDEAEVYDSLGPKMLAALTALGLTLAGRDKGTKGAANDVRPGGDLDELRARRQQRQG